jgi:hypothetical protein
MPNPTLTSERYCCLNHDRRARLIKDGFRTFNGNPLNAIDFLEVVDGVLDGLVTATDDFRQRILLLRFFTPDGLGSLSAPNVRIQGGTTITDIRPIGLRPLNDVATWTFLSSRSPVAHGWLLGRAIDLGPTEVHHWLVLVVDKAGDHATYQLKLVSRVGSTTPPAGFDRVLTELPFAFKIECVTEFDCEDERPCPPSETKAPELDYLARDYQSFRRLMLDRLSTLLPDWHERSPADLGITLVELLAYSADRAAYFQDAVATEAYLNTARLRTSVRRHARLLDYRVHEGNNARVWVQLELEAGQVIVSGALAQGARFFTQVPEEAAVIPSSRQGAALRPQPVGGSVRPPPEVFEAMHGVERLDWAHNEIHFHTWGEASCFLPAGSTTATLKAADDTNSLHLRPGDVLIVEEIRHPETGQEVDADPSRRHAIRLIQVEEAAQDLLYGTFTYAVRWHDEDALPFPFCLWQVSPQSTSVPVTVARGNVVLVDHGATRTDEALVPAQIPNEGLVRSRLQREDLCWACAYTHPDRLAPDTIPSASASRKQDPRQALPALRLRVGNDLWSPVQELLRSEAFAREFVVEMEEDGRAWLRFGDGVLGRRPSAGTAFQATYRTGRGSSGNVGAEAICHLVNDSLQGAVTRVRNPMPAIGGLDPEDLRTVKVQAPVAFRVQQRAVTVEDWAEVAGRHPAVQRAVATLRFTGSWTTVFITVDLVSGMRFDEEFKTELRAFLEPFRLAGIDLELRPPRYVPIDLRLVLCVSEDCFQHEVKAAAEQALGSQLLPDGKRGYFHPDNLTFGQGVYISPIVARLMAVPGVAWVDLDPITNGSDLVRFQRLDRDPAGELEAGFIPVGPLEVARLDNDPSAPDNGRLRLTLRGGR